MIQIKPCIYSNRLINKLSKINKKIQKINHSDIPYIDLKLIKKAIYYAKKYHGAQKRKSGEPYYSHPIEVTYMVSDFCIKNEILVTSILHDTIEDTALTKEMIAIIFNQTIANNVEELTRIKLNTKLSAADIVKSLWKKNQQDLLLIKYFDRFHNILTIHAQPPHKVYKTIRETLQQFVSLSLHLNGTIPGLSKKNQELFDLCFEKIKKHKLQLLHT